MVFNQNQHRRILSLQSFLFFSINGKSSFVTYNYWGNMQPPFHIEKKYALCRCNFSYVQRKLYDIWNSVFYISSTRFCSLLLHDYNSISPGWTLPNRRMVPATWPIKCSELKLPRIIKAIHLSIVLHLVIPSILLSFLECIHQHYCFITVLPVFCSIFFQQKISTDFIPRSPIIRGQACEGIIT